MPRYRPPPPPPSPSHTHSERLRVICRRERIETDTRALLAMCELADNDVRSCLNTLQFLKAQAAASSASSSASSSSSSSSSSSTGGKRRLDTAAAAAVPVRLTVDNLAHLSVGSKDLGKDLFDVWRAVFRLPKPRRTALQQHVQV